jgi:hypothetical protein
MPVLLLAIVPKTAVSAVNALTQQSGRWIIQGEAKQMFFAEKITKENEEVSSVLCIQLGNQSDAEMFRSEFEAAEGIDRKLVQMDLLQSVDTPDIDALGVLI